MNRFPWFAALLALLTAWPVGCGAASESSEPSAADVTTPLRRGIRVPLTVRETAGVGRSVEVVQTGLPLPRSLGARDPRTFAVLGPDGRPVPADFRVLARWNAGLADRDAPIQWLLAIFPASVGPRQSAVYTLVTDGSVANPPPPSPLTLRREEDRILVDTGAAVFRLGGSPGALFDEVRRADGPPLITGGEMTLSAQGRNASHAQVRRVRIEHAGPLSAVVIVEGAYGLPPVGGGGFGSTRRYVFTAGSPAAVVRQAVAWEGNLACQGCVAQKDGSPNGVKIERVRDALSLRLGGSARQVSIVGDFQAAALTGSIPEGQEASVRQRLRARRDAPLRFEVAAGGQRAGGDKADGGLLAVSGPAGTVATAINHLHRYEPQALRLLADGALALDLADEPAWLAHHQGLFATISIAALPSEIARADLDRLVWAPLNHPLRAWPDAAWFAGSGAAGEIPAGPLRGELAAYDEIVPEILEQTVRQIDEEGIAGLLTFGVFPRYWGRWGSPEIQCKGDPTPAERWDDTFWCGTWADYHNTLSTAPLWAMRSGDVGWLDEIGFPGALRTLHTQIMQCAPGDPWFYCGQAPAGYGGYRSDFNSSHAYFENLFLYYWLTGDSTVVETLRRGGESMRRHMCESRGPQAVTEISGPAGPQGPACAPDVPLAKASFTGRVAYQWLAAFRFLGLASEDASFLEDWRSGLARAVTHQYVEVERGGRRYGFLGKGSVAGGSQTYTAGPMWMNAFYDAENLYRLQLDTGDAPIGNPPLPPSRVIASIARSMVDLEARAKAPGKGIGKGKVRDDWPQSLGFTWEGGRLGGRLVALEPKGRNLYGPEKAGMAALLVRAGRQTGDRELLAAGEDLVRFILSSSKGERAPLGKLQGQYLTRLHAAVAGLASDPQ